MNTFVKVEPEACDVRSGMQPITVEGANGQLFAIQHNPEGPAELCIIMLNSGMLNRCGPQRLYWSFAKQACQKGIAVIRVDLAGVGDSHAETNETHFDNHNKDDVNAVVNYAKTQWPQAQIVLQGLCAGSRVSFKAAANNPQIDGLLAWSTEIFTASQNMPQSPHEPEDRLSSYEVSDTLSRLKSFIFTAKFLRPSWWRKEYPGGEGFIDDVKHTLRVILKKVIPKKPESKGDFLASADTYLEQNRKVFFAFGESDSRALNEFNDRFEQIREGELDDQCFQIIDTGTHTFSTLTSQIQLFEKSFNWLSKHFPA